MSVVHCKREPYDVYVGRGSEWGNPFTHLEIPESREIRSCGIAVRMSRVESRDEAVDAFRRFLWARIKAGDVELEELAALDGAVLGCWCAPKRCHAEVLERAAAWAAREIKEGS